MTRTTPANPVLCVLVGWLSPGLTPFLGRLDQCGYICTTPAGGRLAPNFKKPSSDKPLKVIQCKTNDVWWQYKNDKELEELVLKRAEEELRKAAKKKCLS
ncbi:hypothetical protein AVEN_12714-1 [Araneus ventricosus]|uniref:Uncharacterized protein n=1 Tax=Araneus ventricosus TaxID=182803 RepID=A0A4Y2ACU5_ARAVE|nr:hypothetical protein AVEN_12714-1 [Araneus ventricosus]